MGTDDLIKSFTPFKARMDEFYRDLNKLMVLHETYRVNSSLQNKQDVWDEMHNLYVKWIHYKAYQVEKRQVLDKDFTETSIDAERNAYIEEWNSLV